jgi:hypothetical protein
MMTVGRIAYAVTPLKESHMMWRPLAVSLLDGILILKALLWYHA